MSDENDVRPLPKKTLIDSDDEIEYGGFEIEDKSYKGAGVLKFYYTTLNINKKDFNDSRNALLQLEIMEDTQNLNFLKIDLSLSKFLREKIVKISKSDQLPQLFLDDQFIAGFEELCNWVENDKFFENITLSGYRQRMN